MKLSEEYWNNIKNMNLKEFIKLTNRENLTEEEMEKLKRELEKEIHLHNDVIDLITKYGLEKTPQILEIIIDEMKIYLGIMAEFKNIKTDFYNYPNLEVINNMFCNGDNEKEAKNK